MLSFISMRNPVEPFPVSLLHERYVYDPLRGILISKFTGRPLSYSKKLRNTYAGVGYKKHENTVMYNTTYGRLVMAWLVGYWPTSDVDHIDRDTTNNRAWNLRIVTRRENCQNRSTYKGGATKVGSRWKARIRIDGKQIHLGTFDTEKEARESYQKALQKLQ